MTETAARILYYLTSQHLCLLRTMWERKAGETERDEQKWKQHKERGLDFQIKVKFVRNMSRSNFTSKKLLLGLVN